MFIPLFSQTAQASQPAQSKSLRPLPSLALVSLLSTTVLSTAFSVVLSIVPAKADDTAALDQPPSTRPTNIMFLMDNSGSMSNAVPFDFASRSRLQVLKDAFGGILDGMDPNISVGITTYGGGAVIEKGVSIPITPLQNNATNVLTRNLLQNNTRIVPPIHSNSALHRGMFDLSSDNLADPISPTETIKDYIKTYTNSWIADGLTPIPNAIHEVTRYFKGDTPNLGNLAPHEEGAAHPSTYVGSIYEASGSKNATADLKYQSPITDECSDNYLVILSDGQPTGTSSVTDIESYLPIANCSSTPSLASGECASELIEHLATTDLNSTLPGDQHVNTYTIGFGIDDPSPGKSYLELLATKGDGKYFPASNSAGLTQAFKEILGSIERRGAMPLASSAISVDAGSQISHSNTTFIPVMKKVEGLPRWSGNLKKFSIVDGTIVDQNGNSAVETNGSLNKTALDLWATSANTDAVTSGGAASLLNPVSRKLYTDISGTNTTTGKKGNFGRTLNELKTSEPAINLSLLNASDSGYRNELLDYIRGYDVPLTGDKDCTDPTKALVTNTGHCNVRKQMGDILHSKPVSISYDDSDSAKSYVFFGTNEGYLHAINANNGSEKFAFMPQSLLDNIDILYRNYSGEKHPYGVDGPITVWRHDDNKDGVINATDDDFVYLYFGLRRGGRTYYALNVTDPASPKLLWKIDNTNSHFPELGQTWSKPLLAKVKTSSTATEKLAMVIGAGYDNQTVDIEERNSRNSPPGNPAEVHTMGRGVYIIDAENGSLIQSITGINGMNYSIPGDIRVLDMDKNGHMDRLYYSDTGGNIWRTDLFTDTSDPWLLNPTTRKFASLGEDSPGTSLDSRKFFHEPEVSLFTHAGKATLAVTIGSGYHSRPLNSDINDRFYVLIDKNVFDTPTTAPSTITQSDLVNQNSLTASITANTNGKLGWFYNLSSGEKVLSSPFIFLNKVLFTTFKPGVATPTPGDACSTMVSHDTKLYTFSLLDGAAALDFDNDGTKDISKTLEADYILGTPSLFFRTPNCTSGSNCSQIVDIRTDLSPPSLNNGTHTGGASQGKATESIDIGSFLPSVYWLNTH